MDQGDKSRIIDDIKLSVSGLAVANLMQMAHYDLYEVYIFMKVLDAAKQENADIEFRNQDASPSTVLTFRSSPGSIYQASHRKTNYSHARLSFSNKGTLELHLGIYMVGSSKVIHECDIALLSTSVADDCRATLHDPSHESVIASAECKCYQKGLSIGLGRGFVGLSKDAMKTDMCFVANHSSHSITNYLNHHRLAKYLPVTPSQQQKVRDLIDFFRRRIIDFKLEHD